MTDLEVLLQKTSRTFALAIPLLPEPPRQAVRIAYLLFRIVDTFEDSTKWPARDRIEMLRRFGCRLEALAADREEARRIAGQCLRTPPVNKAEYVELLGEIPFVLERYGELDAATRAIIASHLGRTAEGMAEVVARADEGGHLRLTTIDELRAYCYTVAGIVGEMLTELFVLACPQLLAIGEFLGARAARFGEGLQTVNILKDARADAAEGRSYLPAGVPLAEVRALAREALDESRAYTRALFAAGAPGPLVGFCALLVRLAEGTLGVLREQGPGAKLTRLQVLAIAAQVATDIDHGRAPFPARAAEVDAAIA